jgi:ATP-dependent Clp protease adapter protein ClpS
MKERRTGYFRFLAVRGVPLFVHWSLPAGGLLISAFVGFDPYQALFFCLGYVLLVAIHEGGHVVAARSLGLEVYAVDISGAGGRCLFERPHRVRHSVFVYSAGLLAQVALLGFTLLYVKTFGLPASQWGRCLVISFTFVNAVMFVLNLIAQKALDGLDTDGLVLWKLFLHAFLGRPHPHPRLVVAQPDQAPVFAPGTQLLSMPALVPKGFSQGVEILNDRTTPMELVVTLLMRHLELDRDEAIAKMLSIHNNGGLLLPLPTAKLAEQVAAAMASDAEAQGHNLVCRAVVAQQGAPADVPSAASKLQDRG